MEESEYEKQRLANIAANQALLRQLALTSSTPKASKPSKSTPAKSKPSSKRSTPSRTKSSATPDAFTPRRTSSRLAGLPADSTAAQQKREREEDARAEEERKKRARVSSALKFVVPDLGWEGAKIVEREDDDLLPEPKKEEDGEDEGGLREKMARLKLWEKFEPNELKITPERVYWMEMHSGVRKPVVVAGDKMGNLGVLDAGEEDATGRHAEGRVKKEEVDGDEDGEEEGEEPKISQYKLHTRTISSFSFDPAHPSKMYSSSYDGSIRSFDFIKGESNEIFAVQDTDEGLSGLSILPDSTLLYSTLYGNVGHFDPRAGTATTWSCSDKKIGHVSGHPGTGNTFATASLDRTVKLWDLRAMSSSTSSDDPTPLASHESRLSVSSANISLSGQVLTTSYDDTIKIHDPLTLHPQTVIKHNNQTGRWVTILKARWWKGGERVVVGNMGRWVDVYDGNGEVVGQVGRGEEGITAVPAAVGCYEGGGEGSGREWCAGGTGSGKVCLFL